MERMETMMRRSNEAILQQVGVQLKAMCAAMERMKEDAEDKYEKKHEMTSRPKLENARING